MTTYVKRLLLHLLTQPGDFNVYGDIVCYGGVQYAWTKYGWQKTTLPEPAGPRDHVKHHPFPMARLLVYLALVLPLIDLMGSNHEMSMFLLTVPVINWRFFMLTYYF